MGIDKTSTTEDIYTCGMMCNENSLCVAYQQKQSTNQCILFFEQVDVADLEDSTDEDFVDMNCLRGN